MLDTNRNRSDVRERDTGTSPNAAPLQGDAAAYSTTQKGPMFQRKTAPVRDRNVRAENVVVCGL